MCAIKQAVPLATATVSPLALMFEQQKELLMLENERQKLELEVQRTKLDIIRHSEGAARTSLGAYENPDDTFDIIGNLHLLPKFSEADPDSFFLIFERVESKVDGSGTHYAFTMCACR